jgi:hypothetical protein
MSDGRKNNGGNKNAGRKPKAEEHKLIEKLTPLAVDGYKALESALKDKQGWAVKLFFEYMYGKPKQTIDQTSTINLNDLDISKLYDKQTEEDME